MTLHRLAVIRIIAGIVGTFSAVRTMTERQLAAVWLVVGALAAIDTVFALAMLMLGVAWWWIPVALAVLGHVAWGIMAWRKV